MKKVYVGTAARFCIYFLIGLICFTATLCTITEVMPQTADNSLKQTPLLSSSLIWPTQGIISKSFSTDHEGIDIAGASGTPIVAAASGKVIKAGWDDWGLGNTIEIQHPDNSVTVYGHNRRLLVSKGTEVSQSQVIAQMGSTGNSTGPHLHFEVHPNRRAVVNPLRFLPSPADYSHLKPF